MYRTARSAALATFIALLVGGPLALPVQARKPKAPCKQIREAVQAGRTLEQIIAEFHTDAQQVMKCTQKKGKRRKAAKEKSAKPGKSKGTGYAPSTHTARPSAQSAAPALVAPAPATPKHPTATRVAH
jgi:hypothetical protein